MFWVASRDRYEQSGFWNSVHYSSPKPSARSGNLAHAIQTAECYEAIARYWRRRDLRVVGIRHIAQKAVRQGNEPFRVITVCPLCGVCQLVGYSVVHDRQAGSGWISKPSHLNPRRLSRKGKHPVVGHVPRQVNENVNAVLPNKISQC